MDAVTGESFDDFLKRLEADLGRVDPGPPTILPRHASPESILVLRGPSFRRLMLAVLVANLLTVAVVALALLFGLGKLFSADPPSPSLDSGPVSVSLCSPGGC